MASSNFNVYCKDVKSVQIIAGTATTGASGNIGLGTSNDGKHIVTQAWCNAYNAMCEVWVSGSSNQWYLKARDAETLNPVANTTIQYRYLLVTLN